MTMIPLADPESACTTDSAPEYQRRVLARLRLGAFLGLGLGGVGWPLAALFAPAGEVRHHQGFLALILPLAGVLAGGRGRWAERHAVPIAVAYHVAVALCLAWVLAALPGGIGGLAGLVAIASATTALLVPCGPGPQAVVSTAFVAAFLALQPWATAEPGALGIGLFTLGMGMAVSLVGAAAADRQTRRDIAQRRALQAEREEAQRLAAQRAVIVEASRVLGGTLSVDALCERIVEVARWIPGVEHASLSLPERGGSVLRIVATSGEAWAPFRGVEYPIESVAHILEAVRVLPFVEFPDPDRCDPPPPWLHLVGIRRALLATPARGDTLLGVLAVGRTSSDTPFGADSRHLFEVLANRAALALSNARLLAEVRAATDLKARFLSMISHEIRTPLNAITGYVEMLREGTTDRELVLDRLGQASRDLLELVQATLDIGRLEAGHDRPHLEPVRLDRLWNDIGESLAQLGPPPGVRFRWRPAPACEVLTDPRKLRIIVRNLVGNAFKFTSRGEVEATCERVGDRIEIVVRDTGCGIPAAELPQVFEMFRQVDNTTGLGRGGVGLGLYIVRQLAEQLGGRVSATSLEGAGSTFPVELPAGE